MCQFWHDATPSQNADKKRAKAKKCLGTFSFLVTEILKLRDSSHPAWIVIRDGHDGMDLRADPVPLDRYPVKPHRYYMDNFAFPKTSAI